MPETSLAIVGGVEQAVIQQNRDNFQTEFARPEEIKPIVPDKRTPELVKQIEARNAEISALNKKLDTHRQRFDKLGNDYQKTLLVDEAAAIKLDAERRVVADIIG